MKIKNASLESARSSKSCFQLTLSQNVCAEGLGSGKKIAVEPYAFWGSRTRLRGTYAGGVSTQ